MGRSVEWASGREVDIASIFFGIPMFQFLWCCGLWFFCSNEFGKNGAILKVMFPLSGQTDREMWMGMLKLCLAARRI